MTPIDLALICNQTAVVRLLVSHGVTLNAKNNPAMLKAVRCCGEEMVRYLYENGAKLNGLNRVKSSAYDEAYYGNKKNIPLLAFLDDPGTSIANYMNQL